MTYTIHRNSPFEPCRRMKKQIFQAPGLRVRSVPTCSPGLPGSHSGEGNVLRRGGTGVVRPALRPLHRPPPDPWRSPSRREYCRRVLRRPAQDCSAYTLSFDTTVFIVESTRRRVAVEATLENRGENAYSTVLNISQSANLQFASLIQRVGPRPPAQPPEAKGEAGGEGSRQGPGCTLEST